MFTFQQVIDQLDSNHPVAVYFQESDLIKSLLEILKKNPIEADFETFFNHFNELNLIEKRFKRKENQLFPYLEKHGWTGPSQGMWAFQDDLRRQIKEINTRLAKKEFAEAQAIFDTFVLDLEHLLDIECNRLFPNAMNLLSKEDWEEFYDGDSEIGWMLKEIPKPFPSKNENIEEPKDEKYIHPSQDTFERKHDLKTENALKMEEGFLSIDQVNLIFKFLPVDITFVDENDKVAFYNRGEERVFSRSKGIIGREVKFCHPPKSVDMVIRIVDEFRAGTKDTAEFWINMGPKCVHIRYFAVRDKDKNYKGVLEMSQDITDIKKLEGDKRLLDWND